MSHPNFFTLASTLSCTCCEIFLELGRPRKPASVRVALTAFSLATLDPATRSSADVVLCYCFRLPTTVFFFNDLVHRRPGQGSGEGASHSKGVHREMVRQARFSRKGLQGSGHSTAEGGREPRPPSVVATGKYSQRLTPT